MGKKGALIRLLELQFSIKQQHASYTKVFYRTIHIWNKLPFGTRNCPQPQSFRRLVIKSL